MRLIFSATNLPTIFRRVLAMGMGPVRVLAMYAVVPPLQKLWYIFDCFMGYVMHIIVYKNTL